ncbi:IS701 family transposase [Streptomyces sp. NPDC093065]|uniref:IS701 family transposase n=1 Tax=Streptomyces sp. NPDC093065 TaxID=3366021 RepID=UPI0037FAEC0F
MLGEELAAVRCDLEDFAAEMFEPFARAEQRRWGEVYLRGLLLDGGRKSVEPMAARLGEDGNRQALAHFVTTSPWDAAHVRARLAWRMQPVNKPTALIIDDTGFLKDGGASACVTRQYTGTAGKVTNCQAGVSLHLASHNASAAVNWRLFLPESWDPAASKADPVKVARRTSCAGSARPVQWREGSRPGSGRSGHKRMYSRFVALRIRPAGREIRKATAGTELPVRWLLTEWPAAEDEPVQFWLSNLPENTPLPVLVRTAKLRWRIENDYREMKQALGLAHFEGRTWPGWHHHVTLVSVAHAFCTLQRLGRSPKETASA